MKTNELTYCSLLTALVIVFEVAAAQVGELLVAITIFSALPIYILTRKNIKFGLLSYSVVTILLSLINFHQMLFFVFTNGLIGLSLGTTPHFTSKKWCPPIITAIVTTLGLNVISFILGISFFKLFGSSILLNEFIICLMLLLYSNCYQWFAKITYKRVSNHMFNQ